MYGLDESSIFDASARLMPMSSGDASSIESKQWKWLVRPSQVMMLFAWGTAVAYSPAFYVNKDHSICNDFASLLQYASVASMTDDELCTFRFSSLPKRATGRFSFPRWREYKGSDPATEAMRVFGANSMPNQKHDARVVANDAAFIRAARSEKNLKVYRIVLQVPGSRAPLYVEMIDLNHCSKTKVQYQETDGSTKSSPYVYQGFPALGAFTGPSYAEQIAVETTVFEPQVAIYDGNTPMQISIAPHWIRTRSQAVLPASLDVFRRMPASDTPYGRVDETLAAHSMCDLELEPSVAKTNTKVSP